MRQEDTTSTSAKLLYTPLGIVTSIAAGMIAKRVFTQVYKRSIGGPDADAPKSRESEYSWKEVLVAALIQGAIFGSVKAMADRGGARLFQKWTGEWPGD